MRTQPTKVDLGLEHSNTYQQAARARPAEYLNLQNHGSSVAYPPFQPALDLSSKQATAD